MPLHPPQYDAEVEGTGMKPAALVMSRVVSYPNDGMITLDAGSKGLAAEAGSPVAKILGRCNGQGAVHASQPSEEHLPCRLQEGTSPDQAGLARGMELWLFPRHVCPTVNMYDFAVLVESGKPPRTVPVDGRGH